ncbi:hypothetical protein [Pedococcus sp. 5OH_020]|uniref:hypothetical protein n=1 Tax=Pedococcus sp. 5OH_020 TaxID=2989814 RepID=UPI0022E9E4ED|nr:hypothetical protein [Pedococcus sp. 5OH_020]
MNVNQVVAVRLGASPPHYLSWGVVQISVANLVVIGFIIVLFVAAILVPFPMSRRRP